MKPDAPESSSADSLRGPDVNAVNVIWRIRYDLKLRTFLSRVCFANEKDHVSIMSGYITITESRNDLRNVVFIPDKKREGIPQALNSKRLPINNIE
ncbi:hypothetical protein EPR50_G00086030 [Perca flavescens]|uniref:Uncharacterized protein n=2 Tax=Perca TaxID=8166 RepID=A0A6A5F5K7_PERFL|nr:hypothetical protein PFLUV_G00100810 [Perca fluviatilis]TDH09375.1 hypothetical protein EPR50_G00086030 [Perca flavescens]